MQRSIVILLALVAPLSLATVAPAQSAKATKKSTSSEKPTVAVFHLHGSYPEVARDEGFAIFTHDKLSFQELTSRMRKTSKDSAVKAVVLLIEEDALGAAQVEEVRQVLAELRSAGKEIYVHSDSMGLLEYVLASGATRISIVPTSDLWVQGIHGESPYVRGLLSLLGVEPEFLHCGDYKSASEIFMRDGPSPQAEEMQNWLLDGKFNAYLKQIAAGRHVDVAKVHEWIDNGPYSAEKAKAAGLIDAVEHRDAFEQFLRSKLGEEFVFNRKYGEPKGQELDFSNPFAVFKVLGEMMGEKKKKSTKPAIAIVYVEGDIALGGGDSSSPFEMEQGAQSTPIRKALEEVARDDSIKAVVLRVNSPGGSAVASEIILNATQKVKATKPFVVSMGDVAASGGYYVTCASDMVFADENTITGSIGVVGGKIVTTGMWKKIGVTFKSYNRGKNADILGTDKPWTDPERARVQAWMDDIYGVFKNHVTTARGNKLKKPIDALAGGRVYTGQQALELGLVDKIGTLEDAIQYVSAKAKITDYDIRVVPESKNFIEKFLEDSTGEKSEPRHLDARTRSGSLVDLAMPYLKNLDSKRVRLIAAALNRLQLLHQDGVILMAPELGFSVK